MIFILLNNLFNLLLFDDLILVVVSIFEIKINEMLYFYEIKLMLGLMASCGIGTIHR